MRPSLENENEVSDTSPNMRGSFCDAVQSCRHVWLQKYAARHTEVKQLMLDENSNEGPRM